jgi:acyl dehydratase
VSEHPTTTTTTAAGELRLLRLPVVRHATLAEFANASGDRNPLHLDPETARAAGEPDVIAHGMLSMAYLGRLVTTWFPQASLRSWQVRFVAPTPVGAEVTCYARVSERTDTSVTLDVWTELRDGTVTVRGAATCEIQPRGGR